MVEIKDFNKCEYSDRHGTYGGMAGYKDGVIYNDEYWIIKYPKATTDFKNDTPIISYTTAPVSEFIGSHIYDILGYDVHETLLVERKNKIAVACKDFCRHRGDLAEMKTIKNSGNEQLSDELQAEFHDSNTGESVLLKELLLHFEYNPIFKKLPDILDNFWETSLVDIYIDNNDRNNGNRGLLFNEETHSYTVAPVYDNGNSFSNKASEDTINKYLNEAKEQKIIRACGSRTAYAKDGHILSCKKFLNLQDDGLKKAIVKVVPLLSSHQNEINKFIDSIPETHKGYTVLTSARKELYKEQLSIRLEHMLIPSLEKTIAAHKTNETSFDSLEKHAREKARMNNERRGEQPIYPTQGRSR